MKHYRIVRIAGLALDIPLLALYRDNPFLKSQSYADQQKALFRMWYGYSDSFSRTMRALGHDAHEIVYDSWILQKTWAREKGIKYDPNRWQYDIILKQIEDLRPEVVHFRDVGSLPHVVRKNLKREFPFIKLIVAHNGWPNPPSELAEMDALFVSIPTLVSQYQAAGLRPHLVYHAFDGSVLERIGADAQVERSPRYDFTFVGTFRSSYDPGHYQSRHRALIELAKKANLEPWLLEWRKRTKMTMRAHLEVQVRRVLKRLLECCHAEMLRKLLTLGLLPDRLRRLILEVIEEKGQASDAGRLLTRPLPRMFPHRCHPPVFGVDMYRILRQSKVTFNKHDDWAQDSVGNKRMFEATGVGSCLLTDTGKNMADLFEEDHEVVSYSSIEECIEKVNYLLEHDNVRRQIALAGQRRTLKDHTVMNRCQRIDEVLQKML